MIKNNWLSKKVINWIIPSLKLTIFAPENDDLWKFGDSELGVSTVFKAKMLVSGRVTLILSRLDTSRTIG